MANKVLSIEIGYSLTKICEVDFKTKNPKVYACVSIPTPDGVMEDGEIMGTDKLAPVLMNALTANRIHTKQVVFSITSNKIASREIMIPPVSKESRIGDIVAANAKDYFPVDLNDYELSYIPMGRIKDEKGAEKIKVNVLAAPKNILSGYRQLATKCGLTVAALDYAGNSIYQVVRNSCEKDEVTMFVKADERSTIVTIIKNGDIIIQRSLAYGVDEAISTMIESKAYGELDYFTAIQEIRRKTCIRKVVHATTIVIEDDDVAEEESVQIKKAKDNITAALAPMISSIERVADYYNSRNMDEPIKKIYLTGLGGDFSGLSKLMTNELGMKVTILISAAGFAIDKSQRDASFGEYIACLGAAYAPLGTIGGDKSGKEGKEGKESKIVDDGNLGKIPAVCIGLFAAFTAIGILIILFTGISYGMALHTHNAYVDELNGLQEVKATYNQYLQVNSLSAQVDTLYAQTENYNEELVDFIEELEDKMPREISTLSLTANETDITLQFEVSSKEAMALTIQQLRDFKTIAILNVSGGTDEIDDYGFETVSFTIQATYVDYVAAHAETVEQ